MRVNIYKIQKNRFLWVVNKNFNILEGGMQCFVHKIYGGMSRIFLQFLGGGAMSS